MRWPARAKPRPGPRRPAGPAPGCRACSCTLGAAPVATPGSSGPEQQYKDLVRSEIRRRRAPGRPGRPDDRAPRRVEQPSTVERDRHRSCLDARPHNKPAHRPVSSHGPAHKRRPYHLPFVSVFQSSRLGGSHIGSRLSTRVSSTSCSLAGCWRGRGALRRAAWRSCPTCRRTTPAWQTRQSLQSASASASCCGRPRRSSGLLFAATHRCTLAWIHTCSMHGSLAVWCAGDPPVPLLVGAPADGTLEPWSLLAANDLQVVQLCFHNCKCTSVVTSCCSCPRCEVWVKEKLCLQLGRRGYDMVPGDAAPSEARRVLAKRVFLALLRMCAPLARLNMEKIPSRVLSWWPPRLSGADAMCWAACVRFQGPHAFLLVA